MGVLKPIWNLAKLHPTFKCTTSSHHISSSHITSTEPQQEQTPEGMNGMNAWMQRGDKVTSHEITHAYISHGNDMMDPHTWRFQIWQVTLWGITNSPTLQKDLAPRSRTERTLWIQNGGDPRVPKWPLYRNGVTTTLWEIWDRKSVV